MWQNSADIEYGYYIVFKRRRPFWPNYVTDILAQKEYFSIKKKKVKNTKRIIIYDNSKQQQKAIVLKQGIKYFAIINSMARKKIQQKTETKFHLMAAKQIKLKQKYKKQQ